MMRTIAIYETVFVELLKVFVVNRTRAGRFPLQS